MALLVMVFPQDLDALWLKRNSHSRHEAKQIRVRRIVDNRQRQGNERE